MNEYFFDSVRRDQIVEMLRIRPRILAFDFDGTLAPIASSPSEVIVSEKLHYLLRKLTDYDSTVVAVISGRTLDDLEKLIGIASIIYFGNHGMTSSLKDFGASREQLHEWSNIGVKTHEQLLLLETKYPGCIVENKGPIISVHYRNVDIGMIDGLLEKVLETAKKFNTVIQYGKMVIELKPHTSLSKGTALSEIAAKGFFNWRKGDPFLFAGDDSTDEDGFRVMKVFGEKSFGFKIGDGNTFADFRLHDGEIEKLIEMII